MRNPLHQQHMRPINNTATMKQNFFSLSMPTFPPSDQVWTRSDKQLFLVFMRILIKYLELAHLDSIRQQVMEAMAQCRSSYLQLRATSTSHVVCLTSMLHDHLQAVVPEDKWRQAEIYMDQYLRSRRARRNITQRIINNNASTSRRTTTDE
jgi:hypothetical protein